MTLPLRLRRDAGALAANWRWLRARGGAADCGAAVKADGYGLGARWAVDTLAAAGCRQFYVATWAEARALEPMPQGARLSVLHGVRAEDMAMALASAARPVLNTPAQAMRWRATGRPCDVMVDTGMNRLGLSIGDVAENILDGLTIDTLMSHLACADEDSAINAVQRGALAAIARCTTAARISLANSAGICLGRDYAFDLTRPGLGLYGGIPRPEGVGHLAQVAAIEAQVLQVRQVGPGETVGYNATWAAPRPSAIAILNLGYADGYRRAFGDRGTCGGGQFAVVGRVSMDLIAVDVTGGTVAEGDWLPVDYDLPTASAATGISQYELLTALHACRAATPGS